MGAGDRFQVSERQGAREQATREWGAGGLVGLAGRSRNKEGRGNAVSLLG